MGNEIEFGLFKISKFFGIETAKNKKSGILRGEYKISG